MKVWMHWQTLVYNDKKHFEGMLNGVHEINIANSNSLHLGLHPVKRWNRVASWGTFWIVIYYDIYIGYIHRATCNINGIEKCGILVKLF